ncbi:MAG: DNA double-strand break repair nuclease NurA, partial [Dehalococcoidales bacterium]|nr:DNA double-strand break repair nuclease NurA [Dehalococcoidales bacterium]
SLSKINCSRYGSNRVHFYYIKAGQEIARVEIPQWVAKDAQLLDLSHSLVASQCEKGQGYPVALAEAHEQAVVTGADRENFYHLVDDCLAGKKMPVSISAKSLSKKTRWV